MARRVRKRFLTPDEVALWRAVTDTAEPLAPVRAGTVPPESDPWPDTAPEPEPDPPPIPRPTKSGYRAVSGGMAAVHGTQTPHEARKRLHYLSHGRRRGSTAARPIASRAVA